MAKMMQFFTSPERFDAFLAKNMPFKGEIVIQIQAGKLLVAKNRKLTGVYNQVKGWNAEKDNAEVMTMNDILALDENFNTAYDTCHLIK